LQYLVTVYPQDFIEYVVEADSEEEAVSKYHQGDYLSMEEDFTGYDWQPMKVKVLEEEIEVD